MKYLKSWDTVAISLLVAWHLIFFLPVTLAQKFFAGGDITSLFLPFMMELSRALSQARLPLWTPYLESGFPLFAEGQIAALDPVNLLLVRLLPPHLAVSYSILFHLIWMAVGMYAFCRSSGLGIASALFAGFVFGFNGFTLAHMQQLTLYAVASWLPALLFFQNEMQKTRRAGNRTWVAWFFLCTISIAIQFLSGHAQIALMNLILFAIMGVAELNLWNRPENLSARTILQSLAKTSASIALGLGIAAAQLIPAAELLGYSVRGDELGVKFFTDYSLAPNALVQFIAPYVAFQGPDGLNLEYWGYFGMAPLLLALVAFTRRDGRVWVFAIVGIVGLLFALGGASPLYPFFYFVPVFNRFRVPARFLLLVLFAAIFLAATGLGEIQNRLRSQPKLARAIIALIFAWVVFDLAAFAQPFLATVDRTVSFAELPQTTRALEAMDSAQSPYRIFTTIFNESLRPNRPIVYEKQSAQVYSPLALARNEEYLYFMSPAMLDLMNVRYYTRVSEPKADDSEPWNNAFDLDLFQNQVEIPPTQIASLEITSYSDKTQDAADGTLAAEIILSARDGGETRLPLRIGIETADWAFEGYRASGAIKHSAPGAAMTFPGFLLSLNREFNGRKYIARFIAPAANVNVSGIRAESRLSTGQLIIERVLLTDTGGHTSSLAALAHKNDLALVFKSHAVTMLENRDLLPRAFVVHSTQVVSDDQVIKLMQDPGFDPGRVAYLATGEALDAAGEKSASADRVEIVEYAPERVKIRVATDRAGYLMLADSWYPGWVVSVDGRTAAIQRADYIFRAVKLDAGEHSVIFEFRPTSFIVGAVISLMSLGILFAVTGYIWFHQ